MKYLAEIGMSVSVCEGCGITWAAPIKWHEERIQDHKTFYCPNGCKRYYPQENEEEILARLLDQERSCCIAAREEAKTLERQTRAYKGHVTRLKKKLGN